MLLRRRGLFLLSRVRGELVGYPMLLEIAGGWKGGLGCNGGVLGGVGRIRFLFISFVTRWRTYDDDERELLLIEYHMSKTLLPYPILSA